MSKLKVGIVYFDPDDSFWLKACVPLRRESAVATPDPTLSLTLLGLSLGELVDTCYHMKYIVIYHEKWSNI